jgi:hypothetical protein
VEAVYEAPGTIEPRSPERTPHDARGPPRGLWTADSNEGGSES